MKNIVSLIITVVISGFIMLSCSNDSKSPDATLEGLWKLTEERTYVQDTLLNPKIYPTRDSIQPYLYFEHTDFTYYELKQNVEIFIENGTYSVNSDTLIITIDNRTNRMPFNISKNTLTKTILGASGDKIVHIAEKVDELNPPSQIDPDDETDNGEEENNDDSEVAYETYHDQDSDPGSYSNPIVAELNKTIGSEILNQTDTFDTRITQCRYYLKVEKNQTYNVKVFDAEMDFSNLPDRLKYIQIWVTDVPYPVDGINQKAEIRIKKENLTEGNSVDFKTTTGYIYIDIFRYKEDPDMKFKLEVIKADSQTGE